MRPSDEDDEEERPPTTEKPRASRSSSMSFAVSHSRSASSLPKWEGRVIETKKGVVRLLPDR